MLSRRNFLAALGATAVVASMNVTPASAAGPAPQDLKALVEAGIDAALSAGASWADVRFERILEQRISTRDDHLAHAGDSQMLGGRRVELAPVAKASGRWASPFVIDPLKVPLDERVDALLTACRAPRGVKGIKTHVFGYLVFISQEKTIGLVLRAAQSAPPAGHFRHGRGRAARRVRRSQHGRGRVLRRFGSHAGHYQVVLEPAAVAELMGYLLGSLDARGLLVTRFWYVRMLEPQTLTLTGLTRDGVFLVEKGKVVGPVNNFRFNQSVLQMFVDADAYGPPVTIGGDAAPALRCSSFNMASKSDAV